MAKNESPEVEKTLVDQILAKMMEKIRGSTVFSRELIADLEELMKENNTGNPRAVFDLIMRNPEGTDENPRT